MFCLNDPKRIISRDRQYIRRFQSDYGYKSFIIMINFENFEIQKHNKSLRNLVSRRAKKAMLDQETDNTETSNQIDISAVSSPKQEDKIKRPNQGLKRSIQIKQEEINEGEKQEELEEITGQSDPLNLVFSYFDSRFQEIQNQIRKNKNKEPARKKRKI